MAENFFAQFHDDTAPLAPPAGTVTRPPESQGAPADNFFSQFRSPVRTEIGKDGQTRVIMDMTKVQRPDAGRADAIGRGVASGMTANFQDEIRGLVEASGANPDDPASAGALISGALKYWMARAKGGEVNADTGQVEQPEAIGRYDRAVAREREANKAAEENHPVLHGVGEVGGAIATLPIAGGASQAATMGGRSLAALRQGAVYGGASGVGEGEGAADSVVKGAGGALLGGAVGAVAAPAIEGAGYLIKKGTEKLRNTYRGFRDPKAEASRQYAKAYELDRRADPNFVDRMHPSEFLGNPDARLMDLGGNYMRRLADQAGIVAPGAESKLKTELGNRFEGQSGRFINWLNSHFHYPDPYQQSQAIKEVAKNVNRPRYQLAMKEGDRPLMNRDLELLTSSPDVVAAMKEAIKSGRSRSVTEGYGGFNPAVNITEDGRIVFNRGKDGAPAYPNLQFWDATRRQLSDAAEEAGRKGRKEEADVLGKLAKMMNEALDKEVGSYKAARQGAAGFFGADDALEAGAKYVADNKTGISEARDILKSMSPAERRLFQDGFVGQYIDAVLKATNDNRDVLLKIAKNEKAREKLELVLGPEKMKGLEAKIRVEKMFNQVRNAIQGNSMTAKRLYDLGMITGGGLGAHGGYDMDPKEAAWGAIIGLISGAGKHIDTKVATKLVEMMLSRDPQVVEQGFKLISSNPKWFDALRNADTKLGRIAGAEAPTSMLPQLPSAVRADDNQPAAPRPPGH